MQNPGRGVSPGFGAAQLNFFRVTHNGQSERGTTHIIYFKKVASTLWQNLKTQLHFYCLANHPHQSIRKIWAFRKCSPKQRNLKTLCFRELWNLIFSKTMQSWLSFHFPVQVFLRLCTALVETVSDPSAIKLAAASLLIGTNMIL